MLCCMHHKIYQEFRVTTSTRPEGGPQGPLAAAPCFGRPRCQGPASLIEGTQRLGALQIALEMWENHMKTIGKCQKSIGKP